MSSSRVILSHFTPDTVAKHSFFFREVVYPLLSIKPVLGGSVNLYCPLTVKVSNSVTVQILWPVFPHVLVSHACGVTRAELSHHLLCTSYTTHDVGQAQSVEIRLNCKFIGMGWYALLRGPPILA